jgi:hypothetical protein
VVVDLKIITAETVLLPDLQHLEAAVEVRAVYQQVTTETTAAAEVAAIIEE